jgi:uncharacterized repeat protein (TIGR01451 family)
MVKAVLVLWILLSSYIFAMGSDVNYDDKFNQQEQREVNRQSINSSLSGIELKTAAFQERRGKNVPVKKVRRNSRVVYINRVINKSNSAKRDIIVKNPIPFGTKYVNGSARCEGGCIISYSTDGGANLVSKEERGENYNYIEFYFKNIPPHKEYRMGFRAIVK